MRLVLTCLTLTALTGCERSCDAEAVRTAWRALEGRPTAADVGAVLDQSCTDFSFETNKKQILSSFGDCGTDDSLTAPTIPARLAYSRS